MKYCLPALKIRLMNLLLNFKGGAVIIPENLFCYEIISGTDSRPACGFSTKGPLTLKKE